MFKFDQSKALRLAVLAAVFSAGAAMQADAFTYRSASGTGAYGRSFSRESAGGCADGRCAWGSKTTGPNGNTVSHGGTATETGYGSAHVNSSATGPNGGSYDRNSYYHW